VFPRRLLPFFLAPALLPAAEKDALRISERIQQVHLPFNTVADPIFAAPDSEEIRYYTRCGDSAIWTGHYLAAEAYRYAVTRDPAALANAWRALSGLRTLIYVTGSDLLARCAFPVESEFASGIVSEEREHGAYFGNFEQRGYQWIGDTSRDQYAGVFFGLAAAWDLIDDPAMPPTIMDLVWRMLDFLDRNDWKIVMPDGRVSSAYTVRPDQRLALLQIGRHILPWRFGSGYSWFAFWHFYQTPAPIAVEVLDDHGSYFKFNLDSINLYNLIRLENNPARRSVYRKAYDILRNTTDDHQNAFFNMLDRALNGPDARRDEETVRLLQAWLTRPRRDFFVDNTPRFGVCGDNRGCSVIPVELRVPTDFLWQRSPFQLWGGGDGLIEGPGIDYILPYWMARYYGVLAE
jgi:hypothetical protein